MVITKSAKELKPVLMDPKATVIKNPYYLITDDAQVIYVVAPGLNGVEFNKTAGSVSTSEGVTVITCLWGQGILALQRNDEEGEAKEFKIVTLNSGKQVGVPAGWISSLVNVGKGFLVVLQIGAYEESVKQELAYYIVEKRGEIAFEQNPNYSVRPQIATE